MTLSLNDLRSAEEKAAAVKKQCERDYKLMEPVVTKHVALAKTDVLKHTAGYEVIEKSDMDDWAKMMAEELCPDPNMSKVSKAETLSKLKRMKTVVLGASSSDYINMSYEWGGHSYVGSSNFVAKAVKDQDKVRHCLICYGIYRYGFETKSNWKANKPVWDELKLQDKLINWAKYQATDLMIDEMKSIALK